MARNNFSKAGAMTAAGYIGGVVAYEQRHRGTKLLHALEIAADALALSPRRVRSIYYDEPVAQRADVSLGARYRAYMQAKLVEQEARIVALRAELDAMGVEG